MSVDGTCLDIADTPANERAYGRPGTATDLKSAYPQARVLGLVDCGTHAVIGAVVSGSSTSGHDLYPGLLHSLDKDMPAMAGRGLFSYTAWKDSAINQLPDAFFDESGSLLGEKVLVRADGAGASRKFLHHLASLGVQFSVSYPVPTPKAHMVGWINDKQNWQPTLDQDGDERTDAWVINATSLLGLDDDPARHQCVPARGAPAPGCAADPAGHQRAPDHRVSDELLALARTVSRCPPPRPGKV